MNGNEEFSDEVLKQAVCRAWAHEQCPLSLHGRLHAVCGRSPRDTRWAGRVFMRIGSVAAVLMICVGAAAWFFVPISGRGKPVLSPTLVADLFQTHDVCTRMANHQHVAAAIGDDVGITHALTAALHRPVLVSRPAAPGWDFHGASVCPVGKTPAAHLVFTDGEDALSLFSLPGSEASAHRSGARLFASDSAHRVVAFEKDGGLFCLVGSGPDERTSLAALQKMSDAMRSAVAEPAPQTPQDARGRGDDLMYAMR